MAVEIGHHSSVIGFNTPLYYQIATMMVSLWGAVMVSLWGAVQFSDLQCILVHTWKF